jgi:hypothetical protein
VPIFRAQSVREAPSAVQVKVTVLPDRVEPAEGVRSLGAAFAEAKPEKIYTSTFRTRNSHVFLHTFIVFFLPCNTKTHLQNGMHDWSTLIAVLFCQEKAGSEYRSMRGNESASKGAGRKKSTDILIMDYGMQTYLI